MTPDCHHVPEAPSVRPETTHSVTGYILLALGITSMPTRVRFRCTLCGAVFGETRDPEVRRRHVMS